jgi:hypothetical protein
VTEPQILDCHLCGNPFPLDEGDEAARLIVDGFVVVICPACDRLEPEEVDRS